jgi:hypothetical protein
MNFACITRAWKEGRQRFEGRKARDDDITKAMDRIFNARLQANKDRKLARNLEAEAGARRAALEENKVANDEHQCQEEEVLLHGYF